MRQSSRWIALVLCSTLVAAVGGCGSDEPSYTLSGKITRNGQPLSIAADEYVVLTFYEIDASGALGLKSYSASVQPDGTYSAGVEPGKFRVSLQIMKKGGGDQLGGKYTQADSPLTKEVTASEEYPINVEG